MTAWPRLALVGDYPPPHGGVAVHVAALERALREAGVDVLVLDVGRGAHRRSGIVPARGLVRLGAALATAAAERRLVHVHTGGANPKSWALAAMAARARLRGAPAPLLTLHSGLLPAWLAAAAERRRVARAACAAFGRVVAVSEPIAAALRESGVPPQAIAVHPAFIAASVDPGPLPPGVAALRAARAPLLAAALAPTATYGEDLLLAAFARLRDRFPRAALVVFGPGTERGAAARAGPGRGVLALGELDHRGALAVIAAADLFVRPTRADGDALSVREALALGTPVVASAVGHRPPGCLLFDVGDAAALAARLSEGVAVGRRARGGARGPAGDGLGGLLALYRALAAPRPIASNPGPPAEPPCSSP